MLYKCTLFIVVLCHLLFSAEHNKSTLREIIIATDDFPPFRIMDSNPPTGIDYEVMAEIAKRLHLKPVYKKYPWARCLKMMEEGKVDAMFLAKRAYREVYTTYTTPPYYVIDVNFYIKKGSNIVIKTYEDLYKYQIGYVRNSAYLPRFDSDSLLNKYPVNREEQLIKMVAMNRLDAFIGTDTQADYQIAQMGYKGQIEKAEFQAGTNDVYFGISKKSKYAKEVEKFNRVISDMLSEGLIKEIEGKYK